MSFETRYSLAQLMSGDSQGKYGVKVDNIGRFQTEKAQELERENTPWLNAYTGPQGGTNGEICPDIWTEGDTFLRTKLGTKVMFNPGVLELANPEPLKKTLKYVDILLLNKREASELLLSARLKAAPEAEPSLEELLVRLQKLVPVVILTAGKDGGIATDGEKIYRFGLYENVKIKDTTGAGDAFGSGFLAAFSSGKNFKTSLTFASANSTSVVTHLGAKDGLLPLSTSLHSMPIQTLTKGTL